MKPTFFRDPAAFRRWLERHHARVAELWVGFHKKGTGLPSITWPESVDEALCFGWIDGVRKSLDETSYVIRFTPRRAKSTWSAVNIRRVGVLTRLGRMRPAGLAAFRARTAERSRVYSFESRPTELATPYARKLKSNRAAWSYFQAQPPWYRRTSQFWVMSAKKEETRLKRLDTLIACSAKGVWIGPLERAPKRRTGGAEKSSGADGGRLT
jgi:uncharacterized protein YdeI (YjbR/CyaY-like superfamily)